MTFTCVYGLAWKHLSALRKYKIENIRTGQLQRIIDTARKKDGSPYSAGSLRVVKTLAVMLWDYAMQNDIVEKNYGNTAQKNGAEQPEK